MFTTKLRLTVCAALLAGIAIVGTAFAQDNKGTTPPTTVLTVEQTINAMNALASLDGAEVVDKDGKKGTAPYKLSGSTRMAIAVNLDRARAEFKTYQAVHAAMIRQMAAGGDTVPADRTQEFTAEINKVLGAKASVALYRLKEADLNLADNAIPGSTLSHLIPLIDR